MSAESLHRKRLLFVDDDVGFITTLQQLFSQMAGARWEILTATNHAQALAFLSRERVDVVVLDIGMPVIDGIQFLRLLGHTHPGQQVVMLTGRSSADNRKACLDSGAALFLEKPVAREGFAAVFAALDALAEAQPRGGFRGLIRRVGLQEVLQMECLGRKSSILEVFTEKARGRIFICDGSIIHADCGTLQGEVALYSLLALPGGEFNLQTFSEPVRRTIEGHWESLLMEAARLSDEAQAAQFEPSTAGPAPHSLAATVSPGAVRIEEVMLCSGSGEVLHEWEVKSLESRSRLLAQVQQQAAHISSLATVGRFNRLEILTAQGRVVCHLQPDRRLFVRSAAAAGQQA